MAGEVFTWKERIRRIRNIIINYSRIEGIYREALNYELNYRRNKSESVSTLDPRLQSYLDAVNDLYLVTVTDVGTLFTTGEFDTPSYVIKPGWFENLHHWKVTKSASPTEAFIEARNINGGIAIPFLSGVFEVNDVIEIKNAEDSVHNGLWALTPTGAGLTTSKITFALTSTDPIGAPVTDGDWVDNLDDESMEIRIHQKAV